MTIKIPYRSLPLSAFAVALLIGAAPAAYAQCEAGAGGSMVEDMATTQGDTASAAGESGIATDQGGATMDEEGTTTAQSGGSTEESGAVTAESSGATSSGTTQAAMDSPQIEGADEEQIVAMLEQEGYSDVSSVISCGAYYEVEAMQDGEQAKLQVDVATGRVNPL